MVNVKLPDGSIRAFDKPVSVAEVAAAIGPGLAKAALGGKVNGKLVDTSFVIDKDSDVAIVTDKDAEGLELIRHSTAHLLAYAVKELFPDAQVTIGPVIDNGFYYDFSYKRPFTPEDLAAIEKRMAELVKRDIPVSREVWPRDKAVEFFKSIGEHYKAEIIASIPAGEDVSLYREGDFIDLCRGPHVPSTGKLKVFKLMKLAGAYWRGDSKNEMLQRIYGTAWAKKEDQDAYLHMLEEAEKRDHRRLAKQLDLFHMQDEAPGLVFWHPHGWTVWQQVEQYMRRVYQDHGYQEVKCPQILDRTLWEKSGHWENLQGEHVHHGEREPRLRAQADELSGPRADIQFAVCTATATCRCATANSARATATSRRALCTASCACAASRRTTATSFAPKRRFSPRCRTSSIVLINVYRDFGFDDIIYKLSTRPAKRVGSDETWDIAEKALADALNRKGVPWELVPGEGAFLRTENRVLIERFDRARLAMRHDTGRLLDAGAAGRRIRGRGQHAQRRR